MSISTEKAILQVTFQKEKLEALRFYMNEKELSVLEIIRYNPKIIEEYDENLFLNTVENIIIGENHEITFKLINNLELTEHYGK